MGDCCSIVRALVCVFAYAKQVYYLNTETGETTWTRPEDFVDPHDDPADANGDEWEVTEEWGTRFYTHRTTGQEYEVVEDPESGDEYYVDTVRPMQTLQSTASCCGAEIQPTKAPIILAVGGSFGLTAGAVLCCAGASLSRNQATGEATWNNPLQSVEELSLNGDELAVSLARPRPRRKCFSLERTLFSQRVAVRSRGGKHKPLARSFACAFARLSNVGAYIHALCLSQEMVDTMVSSYDVSTNIEDAEAAVRAVPCSTAQRSVCLLVALMPVGCRRALALTHRDSFMHRNAQLDRYIGGSLIFACYTCSVAAPTDRCCR